MNLRLPQIVFSMLLVAFGPGSMVFAQQAKVPDLQVYVYVSDGSFPCSWCDKFKTEVLSNWEKQGWPIGPEKTNHIRTIPCVSGPVPYFEIYRKGERTAKHAGFLDKATFRKFVKKYIPEWFEREKQEPEEQKPEPVKPPAPKFWKYGEQLLLGN